MVKLKRISHSGVGDVVLSGGVACNSVLRARMADALAAHDIEFGEYYALLLWLADFDEAQSFALAMAARFEPPDGEPGRWLERARSLVAQLARYGSQHARDGKWLQQAKDSCVMCHDEENSPDFDYATYWEKIKH